jgi:hypothetical protein
MQRLVLGFCLVAFAALPLVHSLTPTHKPLRIQAAPKPPDTGPKAPKPPEPPKNPLQKQLKKGQVFYRLDDRTGKLSCDKWTLTPGSKEEPSKGTLTFTEKKTDRSVVYTYNYKITNDGPSWEFQINGIKGGKIEKFKGGVNYSQDIECQEIYELGEVRKTDFDLGSGVWYLNKAACDKAKKASATKSPGSC